MRLPCRRRRQYDVLARRSLVCEASEAEWQPFGFFKGGPVAQVEVEVWRSRISTVTKMRQHFSTMDMLTCVYAQAARTKVCVISEDGGRYLQRVAASIQAHIVDGVTLRGRYDSVQREKAAPVM